MHSLDNNTDEVDCGVNPAEESAGASSDSSSEAAPGITAEACVLTIPGAVYRIPINSEAQEKSETAPAVALPVAVASDPSGIYVGAVADENADDNHTYAQGMPVEPNSQASPATIGETVVVDTETGDAVSGAAPLEAHPAVASGDFLNGDGQYEGFIEAQEQADGKARKKKRTFSDNDAVDLCLPVDSIDRSVKLVESRLLYEIESMKTERRMLGYTFSLDLLKKDQTAHKMRRQINERISKLSRALENERDSSTRYYSAALDRYEGNAGKRGKNAALIESLLGRLDYALKEREQIEERLMRLYVMDADEAEPTKEAKVAARAAKASYRSQLKTARRVARMHAPDELKEKIFTLMNERTTMLATIEKNEYLLRKKRYTGADKRDVKRQNREMRRAIRHKEADVRFFIKKAEKHDTAHGDGIRQIGWLVVTLIFAGAIGGLYLLGKYYWGLF